MNQEAVFQQTVISFYLDFGRHDMPWRQPEKDGSIDPYKILVSEIMLQQTQVSRVIPKFDEFLRRFPTIQSLAQASQGSVLTSWSGLGYNRRALYLHQAAKRIVSNHSGKMPSSLQELIELPGIGRNTAGAILAYAFNEPAVFIETNIRTVYIHHFFQDHFDVQDAQLIPLIQQTMDTHNPREWYWALMDYGSFLKREIGNLNQQSKHYAKQSKFDGSNRQIRGAIIKQLTIGPSSHAQLAQLINDERVDLILNQLLKEGLIKQQGKNYAL